MHEFTEVTYEVTMQEFDNAIIAGRRQKKLIGKRNFNENTKLWKLNNKQKLNENIRNHYARNSQGYKDRTKRYYLKKNYNLTIKQWNELFIEQGSCCKICKCIAAGGRGHWHTDHDHKTGKIRGILCNSCNLALGHFKDSVLLLMAAIEHLNGRIA